MFPFPMLLYKNNMKNLDYFCFESKFKNKKIYILSIGPY